ncbi:MAG: peptidoglycan editing factor PgeF [Alphaproteobacteria bacterium]|nr:peptidoglycan editing factor PgeF [Alphaproteobacteria bacterium]
MSWQAPNLTADKHCFFGTSGGVSTEKYASLNTNLRSLDQRDNVLRNMDIITDQFHLTRAEMATMRQSVSNTAIFIDKPTWFETAADGMVTTTPNILLCIKTADCAPVLLADYEHGVIGAAHAGWRGACKGIIANVVRLMTEHGAEKQHIRAAIGPCLQKESFAAQEDMRQVFLDFDAQNAQYFTAAADGYRFDLSTFVEDKLRACGVQNIVNSKIDTYPAANGYFSYRRNTHLNLISQQFDYPTQYSVICL